MSTEEYKIRHDRNSVNDETIRRLMKENQAWRTRFENIERIISEVSPESDGLKLEARISQLIGKNFEATSKGTRMKLALKQVREMLVPEGGVIVSKAKSLIDHFLWNDKSAAASQPFDENDIDRIEEREDRYASRS